MRRHSTLAVLVMAAGLVLTGCANGGSAAPPAASPEAAAGETSSASAQFPDDLAHIHGLGRNPADGLLYVGTHSGLYVVDGTQVSKVGDAGTDLMGFAVAGPDHFLASGHPGPDDDLPNPVGLIESRDAGQTWQPVSQGGRSDLHTLSAAGSTLVGFDGALRLSDDGGRTWQDGDDVRPPSVALSPDATTVIATTERGPVRSTDGGRSFEPVDGAPVVVLVAWADDATVWAVDPSGVLHVSVDAGLTWEQRAATGGQPYAIGADPSGVVVATATRVVASADGVQLVELAR